MSNPTMPKRKPKFILLISVVFVITVVSGWYFLSRDQETSAPQTGSVKGSSQATLDEIQVERTLTFPGLDPQNTQQPKGTIEMSIPRARKLSQVQVKGEPIDAPENKVFLALDLELSNSGQEALGFFSRDYFRLLKNGKPYAPQFYNRGVGIAPVSVKNDRIAFLVEKDEKIFQIQVGELNGEKEILELRFQR